MSSTRKQRREALGVSAMALAREIGVHWRTLYRWEAEETEPILLHEQAWEATLTRLERAAQGERR